MQLIDTSTIAPEDRADAVTTLMREIALATRVIHDDPQRVSMSTRSWRFGPVELVNLRRTGMYTTVPVDVDDREPELALNLGAAGGGAREQFGVTIEARAGKVDMMELHRPYRSWMRPVEDAWCLKVPVASLALPTRTISRAREGMTSHPLQHVFTQHLLALRHQVPKMEGDPAAAQLGIATLALARALIGSAGDQADAAAEGLHDSLVLRVQAFIHEHLRDRTLSGPTIAAAHGISVRQLYKALATHGIQLEQYVLERRLDAARWELSAPRSRHRSIAAIAHECGFVSASHFSRRFRDKYGMPPGELRRLSG